ncbi:ABC transporter permease [Micromonospora sp. LOL_021]|uniref:ABC transporter permease n=1 Tax=Micromonospora sp. LOL_021 TaxID=3345417 RepID=UPI003A835E5D
MPESGQTSPLVTPIRRRSASSDRLSEMTALARRSIIHLRRRPTLLVFSILEPVLLLLLFRFVFGGAVEMSIDTTYANFMIPGILVQTAILGAVTIGAGLARDLEGGMLDRLHSLPIAPSSLLVGHTVAGLLRTLVVLSAMVATGWLIGFRPTAGLGDWLGALGLLLLCALAMAWVTILVALLLGGVEMVETLSLSVLFPLTLVSSAFVPVATIPPPVQVIAAHQPVTAIVDAVRALLLGRPAASHLVEALAWSLMILTVFAAAAVMLFRWRVHR